jgi:tetratricopeptide (TPR) repeat protein/O-antigen ligase
VAALSDSPATGERRPEAVDVSVRALAIALAGACLGYYIVTGMPQLRLSVFGPTVALHMVTAALVFVYAVYLLLYRRLPGGTPIDWPVALVVGAYALATAASINWRVSLENMFQVLMVVIVFYALSDVRILRARDVQRSLMLAGAAASFYALWVVGHDYADWLALARTAGGGFSLGDLIPPAVPRVHDVSDHPNLLAMTLVLIIPLYAVTVYRSEAWWERVAAGVGLVAAIAAIFLTLSRGGWFGAAVGLTVTAGGIATLAWAARGGGFSAAGLLRWLRAHRTAVILAGLTLLVLVALGALFAAAHWESRPQWLFRGSLSPRQDVLSAGLNMYKDHPLLGTGPNTYALLYPEYSGKYPIHGVHAHNAYLQAAIDLGLPGLAALLVLAGVLGWMLWRIVRGGTLSQRLLAVACGGALAGFLAHGLVDAPNIWKAPLVALAAVGAVVVRLYHESQEPGTPAADGKPSQGALAHGPLIRLLSSLRVAPRLLVIVIVVVLLAGWSWIDTAHAYYSRGVTRAAENRLSEAVSDASRAVDLDPDFAIYHLQLGLTEVQAYLHDGSRERLDQAIQHLRRGIELEPRSAIGYANLARALELAGQREEARAAALEAGRWAGTDEAVVLAAGTVLEDLGQTEDAIQTYANVISLNASLVDSPFWTSSAFRQEHYGEILSRSVLTLNSCGFADALARSTGGTAEAVGTNLEQLAKECAKLVVLSPDNLTHRIELGETLLALGDMEGAEEHLRFVIRRQPDNGRARTALGRWYASQGDLEAARHEWVLAGQLEDPEGLLLLGDSYPPGEVPQEVIDRLGELLYKVGSAVQSDILSILYYRMKFGRAAPITILIPGDWQQAVPGNYVAMQQALSRWLNPGHSPGG